MPRFDANILGLEYGLLLRELKPFGNTPSQI